LVVSSLFSSPFSSTETLSFSSGLLSLLFSLMVIFEFSEKFSECEYQTYQNQANHINTRAITMNVVNLFIGHYE
jgi:hypothetical protein